MCSITAARIARICRAIEELADRAGQHGSPAAVSAEDVEAVLADGTAEIAGLDSAEGVAGLGETTGDDHAETAGQFAAGDDVADRLAAIWAMIAEVDPELARRLPGYLTAAE